MTITGMLKLFSDKRIVDEVLRLAKNREVVPQFLSGVFGKRPSTLMYKNELLSMIRKGALSYHISEEKWRNPMGLEQANDKKKMDSLRLGWDLLIDIDTSYIGFAKICCELLVHALEFHGIKDYSIKFSGGSGFHIGVPFENFPEKVDDKPVKNMFPEAAQIIAAYLSEMIREKLKGRLLDAYSEKAILRITKKDEKELFGNGFDPYSVIGIDTIAISPRHLFRMPYSLNMKKNFISLPLCKDEVEGFEPEKAGIERAGFSLPRSAETAVWRVG